MLDSLFDLESLGWDDFFRSSFQSDNREGCIPGRIVHEHRGRYQIFTERGELWSSLSGRLRHKSSQRDQLPAAGDWVVIRQLYDESSAAIVAVLPRKSQFIRGAAGDKTEPQVIAANIDTVFLMMAVNRDFNLRRIERYLVMAWGSGAQPVVVLSKSDLCADPGRKALELETLSMGAPVHVVSVLQETGLGAVRRYFVRGKTVALLGSSGVGKSTLINYLFGDEVQKTQEVRRHDGRGRHTTTSRQLMLLPGGGLVMDTPGIRELQLWDGQDRRAAPSQENGPGPGMQRAFGDIESLAEHCRYRDCVHGGEPDCAVQAALASDGLDAERFRSYEKLRQELRYQERRRDKAAEIKEKNKWKMLCRSARERAVMKRRG